MSHNQFGHLFRVTTWGESHGPAIGCVIDGCPPDMALDEGMIQPFLDQRKPGGSRFVTQRKETDKVKILSGVYQGKTTGTPIALHIDNVDARSKDYADIEEAYRPGHADFTYDAKYGHRDPRGGGRSSARETAARVAAGAVARLVLDHVLPKKIIIRAHLTQMGIHKADTNDPDWAFRDENPFFSTDPSIVAVWEDYLDTIRKSGSSIGAIVAVEALSAPPGLGSPLYGKLDQEIASALMGINAVKGVEIGAGFDAVIKSGEDNADHITMGPEGPVFLTNHAGGILGGISTGQTISARMALKATSSILTPVPTITRSGKETMIMTKGRHDPCVGIRAVPVAEAMVALVLADGVLRHRAQCG